MQFGLKKASADGEECPDGQKPATTRRRGRAKAKAKASPKAKAKGSPKAKAKGKAKSKAKAKAKAGAKKAAASAAEVGDIEGGSADIIPPSQPRVPEQEVAAEPNPPGESAVSPAKPIPSKPKRAPRTKKDKGEDKEKDKVEKTAPKGKRARKSEEGGKEPAKAAKVKCFARRRRPSGDFPAMKWDAIRQAFQQKVMPFLTTYSAHEDWSFTNHIVHSFFVERLYCFRPG